MKTTDFFYNLPPELIAQSPATPRDSSRLLVIHRKTGELEHRHFYDICDYLHSGDVLVINNTRVIPARLFGTIDNATHHAVECLLLKRLDLTRWEIICKPAKKLRPGTRVVFTDELSMVIESVNSDNGIRIVNFEFDGVWEELLDRIGQMPLPPYITEKLEDKERYQTVYSKVDGSAAAPTAGLHFTPELLDKIRGLGVQVVEVLLHVGLSTFRPVKAENVEEHKMHTEYYELSEQAAATINAAKAEGRRVIAVGTTSVRTLESAADVEGHVTARKDNTSIFIYPPYEFKIVDALITNFHLPESTLVMLVSAMCSREIILHSYEVAVQEKYRFFSFGDATFIV